MTISVAIVAMDEEANIGRTLASVRWADEIVLVDSGSRDRTCEIAQEHCAQVTVEPWRGYVAQKQYAIDLCTKDWVLLLDADEEVSPGLAEEIRAAIALQRDQPAQAVELLASASPYERAHPEAVYLRGLAYLSLREGAEAAVEFEKILDHKGANWGSDWQHPYWGQFYSLSYLGLARASALVGDTAKSRKAFQDFLALWKDADPNVPILKRAKAEYAKLQ